MGFSGSAVASGLICAIILAVLYALIEEIPLIILRLAASHLDPARSKEIYQTELVPELLLRVSHETGISPLRHLLVEMQYAVTTLISARRGSFAEVSRRESRLQPNERWVLTVHRHPAVLLAPILISLMGLAAAGAWTSGGRGANASAVELIWLAWGLLLVWLAWSAVRWSGSYYILTNQRILMASGVLRRRVRALPIAEAARVTLNRSAVGKRYGYGDIQIQSNTGRLQKLDYVPYPEQFYLELDGLRHAEENR
jgi:membrane protein YdbS with pleckstrin-like domain